MSEPRSELSGQVERIVHLLVRGRFDEIVQLTQGLRLDAASIRTAISSYGRTLVDPPQAAFQEIDVIEVEGSLLPTWSIWFNLWTADEGMSDLAIDLTLTKQGNNYTVELDDIHVH